jgi:hypothetical protein
MSAIPFSAKLGGSVNGETIHVTGKGHVDAALGVTDGTYDFRVPADFDPMLLSAFLICGYPNATACMDKVTNVFAAKSYEYRRTLKLREGGEIQQRAAITYGKDGLESQFYLTGYARVPKLTGVEPVVESWEPNGPGGIRGHFAIAWTTEKGFLVVGDANSSYQIDTTHEQAGLLHRFIIMRTLLHASMPRLREVQTEGLFSILPFELWVPDEKRRETFQKEFEHAKCA